MSPVNANDDGRLAADWAKGEVILDLYEVKEIHAAGNMGLVVRVHHLEWNVDLAIKSPRPEFFANEADKDNFEQEAETWVNLGLHPHVASCFYVRRIGGIPHIFAEYMEGGSLSDWIRERRLYQDAEGGSLGGILDIAIQFAWGLHYSHESGIVHQDVKPSNVLMTNSGIAKVTDFGLARARPVGGTFGKESSYIKSVSVHGSGFMTEAYASPEQRAGQSLTRKTDIWSWAASLLEMFDGGCFWGRGAPLHESLDSFLERGSDVDGIPEMPPTVTELLRHCFCKNPEDRPRDMLEIVAVLTEAYLDATGNVYSRTRPDPADLLADSLNNQAVSLWDLGRTEMAEPLWERAISIEPHHPESTYNLGLFRWRTSRQLDSDVLKALASTQAAHREPWRFHYLFAQIHMERGDCRSALAALEEIDDQNSLRVEIQKLRGLALTGLPKSRRLLRTMTTAGFNVGALWMSPDGHWAICGTNQLFMPGLIELWDVTAGEKIRSLEGHLKEITCLHASEDVDLIVSGGADNSIKVWDAASGKCIRTLKENGHTDSVCSVWISRDKRLIASGGQDGNAKIWDVETEECRKTLTLGGYVQCVYITLDGKRLITAGKDDCVHVWDIETGREVGSSGRHFLVKDMAVDRSQQVILTCGGASPRNVKVWNMGSGECTRTLFSGDDEADGISLTPDGVHAIVVGQRSTGDHSRLPGTLRIWNIETGRCLCTLPLLAGEAGLRPSDISTSDDGSTALVAGSPSQLQLWSLAQPAAWQAPAMICRAVGSDVMLSTAAKFQEAIAQAKVAQESNFPVSAARKLIEARSIQGYSRAPEAIALWAQLYRQLPRTRLRNVWEIHASTEHRKKVHALCVSRDGHRVFSGGSVMRGDAPGTESLMVWDLHRNGLHEGGGGLYHKGDVVSLAVSGNNRCLIAASDRFADPNNVTWWQIQEDIPIPVNERKLRARGHITSVALNYDGSRALLGGSHGHSSPILELWDTNAREVIRKFEGHEQEIDKVWLSPDGLIAVSAGGELDGRIKIWDVITGDCLQTFEGNDWWPDNPVYGGLAVSENLQTILTGGFQDRKLKLWNLRTAQCITLEGHHAGITSVCLSSDCHFSFSASIDGSIRIWNNENGECVQEIHAHRDEVTSLAVTLDGQFMVSCSKDEHVKFWFLDWELGERDACDWDAAGEPFVEEFLSLKQELSRDDDSAHEISEKDVDNLMYTLSCVGLGCLTRVGVQRHLLTRQENWSATAHRRLQRQKLAADRRPDMPNEVLLDFENDRGRINKTVEATAGNWVCCGKPNDPDAIRRIISTEVKAEFGHPYANVVNLIWDIVKSQLITEEDGPDKENQSEAQRRSSPEELAEGEQESSYDEGRMTSIVDTVTKEWILCDRPTEKDVIQVLITSGIEREYGFYRDDLNERIWMLFRMHLKNEGIEFTENDPSQPANIRLFRQDDADIDEPKEDATALPWDKIVFFSASSGFDKPSLKKWQAVLPDQSKLLIQAFAHPKRSIHSSTDINITSTDLESALSLVQATKRAAVNESNFELAAAARDLERHLAELKEILR